LASALATWLTLLIISSLASAFYKQILVVTFLAKYLEFLTISSYILPSIYDINKNMCRKTQNKDHKKNCLSEYQLTRSILGVSGSIDKTSTTQYPYIFIKNIKYWILLGYVMRSSRGVSIF